MSTRLNLFSYIFLIFTMIGSIGMLGGNLLISSLVSNNIIVLSLGKILVYFFYFGIFIFGMIKSILIFIYNGSSHTTTSKKHIFHKKWKSIIRQILIIISYITFFLGIIFAFVTIFGSFEFITTFIAIISSQFGLFFSFIFFANTLLLIKLKKNSITKKSFRKKLILGSIVSFILLLPYLTSGITAQRAEINFSTAFGNDWESKIPKEINSYFLSEPFVSAGYFLGVPPKKCDVKQDIIYYKDDDLSLLFDVYLPERGFNPVGRNSTLIRIHGGAWTSGDKGELNNVQMNKYFASQGYIVFDIQYGLKGIPHSSSDSRIGDYNIDDMLNHIGKFTFYLVNNSNIYGVNLESVFISGGSSGGHLTCAAALAISSGNYTDIFHSDINIKGFIPFYPANGAMVFFGIDGKTEFKDPSLLITKNSPPCLIFQGTHDILNYFGISNTFQKTYIDNSNDRCGILWMPFGGHGSDFYFSGYYNQIFLYYMERFMYLNQ